VPTSRILARLLLERFDDTPTTEELLIPGGADLISATTAVQMCVVPFPLIIRSAAIVCNSSVAVDDANYWLVQVRWHRHPTINQSLVNKTTRATDGGTSITHAGEAFTAKKAWTFHHEQWNMSESFAVRRVDDVLDVGFTKVGSPGNLANVAITLRYEPR
jgi:hypothetical protein